MTKVYDGNFRILLKWLERMKLVLHQQGAKYEVGDGGAIDKINGAINALHCIQRERTTTNLPASNHFQVGSDWIDNSLDEFFNFNSMGDEYICSTLEAAIKCYGIKKLQDKSFENAFYYRGEHIFGWELVSRLGRTIKIDWTENDHRKVTAVELKLLAEFQSRWAANGVSISLDHPGWWSMMQHYDVEHGTRMLDVTSSMHCGLFFACANWDGSVDSSVDGKLYMFPYQPGRGETDSPDTHRGRVVGSEDRKQLTADNYFTIEGSAEFPRFRVSPARNDRALSQDGFFVWQPFFDQPLQTFQLSAFRIHRDYKRSILSELAAMGYTRERILATNRFGM